ncbi:MAG: peptidylprolyl isomerase, partial [Myxococcales bacterium]
IEAPTSNPELRAKKRAAAEAALAEVKEKDPRDLNAFGHIARLRSEDPQSRPVNGDLAFKTRAELEARAGREVAEVAFAMREPGRFHDGVVETDKGFHIIKLSGRESPLDLKFADVKDAIRTRLIYEKRAQNYNKFIADLQQRAGLKIDDKVLEGIKIDLGAPTPSGPPNLPLPPAPANRINPDAAAAVPAPAGQ